MRRLTRAFTAPFVLTVALAPACTKESKDKQDSKKIDVVIPMEDTNPPPPGRWNSHPGNPDVLVPPNRELVRDHSTIKLDAQLICTEYFRADCDPGEKCNPPEPQIVPCPPELMPRAAPGALIWARDTACFTVDTVPIPVACPDGGPTLVAPDPYQVGGVTYLDDVTCIKDGEITKIECPDALLPTLQNGLKPDANDNGKCSYRGWPVKCP